MGEERESRSLGTTYWASQMTDGVKGYNGSIQVLTGFINRLINSGSQEDGDGTVLRMGMTEECSERPVRVPSIRPSVHPSFHHPHSHSTHPPPPITPGREGGSKVKIGRVLEAAAFP